VCRAARDIKAVLDRYRNTFEWSPGLLKYALFSGKGFSLCLLKKCLYECIYRRMLLDLLNGPDNHLGRRDVPGRHLLLQFGESHKPSIAAGLYEPMPG